jgi:SAM-dependent methyltransferase
MYLDLHGRGRQWGRFIRTEPGRCYSLIKKKMRPITTSESDASKVPIPEPWQLRIFRRSLKKQQKLQALKDILGSLEGQQCLLITCGDNNGALNWHFKAFGGHWSWVDAERDGIDQIREITGDPVFELDKEDPSLPFPDDHFDTVLTIDVHEHLQNPEVFNAELARIVKPEGRVIVTTPGGDQRKLANRMKHRLGMRKEDYGHIVDGYAIPELERQLNEVHLTPYMSSTYSRFFTEMIELAINLLYVKVMAKRSKVRVHSGQIAPQSKDQLQSVDKSYKFYSLLYPLLLAFSKLDHLTPSKSGYAVIVAGRKE